MDAGATTHVHFQKYTVGSLPKRKYREGVELPQHIFFFWPVSWVKLNKKNNNNNCIAAPVASVHVLHQTMGVNTWYKYDFLRQPVQSAIFPTGILLHETPSAFTSSSQYWFVVPRRAGGRQLPACAHSLVLLDQSVDGLPLVGRGLPLPAVGGLVWSLVRPALGEDNLAVEDIVLRLTLDLGGEKKKKINACMCASAYQIGCACLLKLPPVSSVTTLLVWIFWTTCKTKGRRRLFICAIGNGCGSPRPSLRSPVGRHRWGGRPRRVQILARMMSKANGK